VLQAFIDRNTTRFDHNEREVAKKSVASRTELDAAFGSLDARKTKAKNANDKRLPMLFKLNQNVLAAKVQQMLEAEKKEACRNEAEV
jgi:hypothetical protein